MLPTLRIVSVAAMAAFASLPAAAQFNLKGLLSGIAGPAAVGAAADAATAPPADAAPAAPADPNAPAAAAPAPPAPVPTPAEIQAILQAPPAPLDAPGIVKGTATLKGKRFYIAEYRVLFEVEGKVTANTRAAYFGGTNYGATRVSVNYKVPQPNIGLLQAITDRGYADFLARLEAAGAKPEATESFVRENGAIYESTADATRMGAEVYEEVDLGYGKRKYLVFVPTGTKMVARSFIGLGAGNIGKRIDFTKGNLEGVSVGMVVNLAAQESSGGGSSLFKRGSNANASAAMEVATAPKQLGVLQTHAHTHTVSMPAPLPVPGQFANLREVGGYDTQKDALVKGIQILGALTMGVAANSSKTVDMVIDVDQAALARQAMQGVAAVNQAAVSGIN
jgi:hypothetical protein